MTGIVAPPRPKSLIAQPYMAAFLSGSVDTLRDWFSRNTGPRVPVSNTTPITGEVVINSQGDADALAGRVVRGRIRFAANNIRLVDFRLFMDDTEDGIGVTVPYGAQGIEVAHGYLNGSRLDKNNKGIGGGTKADVYVHHIESEGFSDGLRYQAGGRYEYIYVHDVMDWGNVSTVPYDGDLHPHIDGSQFVSATGGGGFRARRMFIEALPGPGVVSCIIMNAALGIIDGALIEESFFNGGLYSIRNVDPGEGFPAATNVIIRNNMFAPGWGSGGGLWDFMDTASVVRYGNLWMRSHRPVPLTNGPIAKPADSDW